MTSQPDNERTIQHFADLIEAAQSKRGLVNFTFWCGAGFSKSWNDDYPSGRELFQGEVTWQPDILPKVCSDLGLDLDAIEMTGVKEIVYALDMYRKYPDIQGRYIDEELARACYAELVDWVQSNLEKGVEDLGYVDQGCYRLPLPHPLSPNQRSMIDFFAILLEKGDASPGYATGIRPQFITTNYDLVIETIFDNLLGEEDSHFIYVYRGFTPTKICQFPRVGHEHWLAFQLLKLNGGLEIRENEGANSYYLDYAPRNWQDKSEPRPKLILPSREQDYSDPYSQTIFRKAVRLLRESQVLVMVGYSFPEEDALLRFLLRQFAESAEDAIGKHLIYVDLLPDMSRIRSVFPHLARDRTLTTTLFEGSFGAFAEDINQQLETRGLIPRRSEDC